MGLRPTKMHADAGPPWCRPPGLHFARGANTAAGFARACRPGGLQYEGVFNGAVASQSPFLICSGFSAARMPLLLS
jgi:hypothetical protein